MNAHNRDRGPRLADPALGKLESNLLYLMLLRSEQYSFLPELFEAVNEDVDAMSRLLQCFAGMTITFPTIDQFERTLEEVRIFLRVKYAKRKAETRAAICAEYAICDAAIDTACERMSKLVKESGIKV